MARRRKLSPEERKVLARQRPPLKILGIEEDGEHVVVTAGGELRSNPLVILAEKAGVDENGNAYEGVGAMRDGYYCCQCLDPQDEAWPETCVWCGFEIRAKQPEYLARAWQGNIRMGPSTTQDQEEAFMEEWALKARRESRDEILRPTQVWLPGDPI